MTQLAQQQSSDLSQQLQNSQTEESNDSFINERGGEADEENPLAFDKARFIEEIRKFRCLWDVNSEFYKDRNIRNNAWEILANIFKKKVGFLQRQLKNLKDNLKKCIDKRIRLARSGAAASSLPKCKYFDQMIYLREKNANKPSQSNISSVVSPMSPSIDEQCNPIASGSKRKEIEAFSPVSSKLNKMCEDAFDTAILKQLGKMNQVIQKINDGAEECEDSLYCRSLVPILASLPYKKRRLAKLKISQLLFDIEFNEE